MSSASFRRLGPLLPALALVACGSRTAASPPGAGNAAAPLTDAGLSGDGQGMMLETPSPQQFANIAASTDAFEIAAAKLAQTHAAAPAVKAFAAKMIAAHTDSTARIKSAAADGSPPVTPDPTLSRGQSADLAALAKLQGAAFDTAYVAGQVTGHQHALGLFESYAAAGTAPALKAAAAALVPMVKEHLASARALAGQ